MTKKKNPHWGTTLDAFLDEEGIREAVKVEALTRVVARQLVVGLSGVVPAPSGRESSQSCARWHGGIYRRSAHRPAASQNLPSRN